MIGGREEGAILVQVALMSTVLLGCVGFVIDYGVVSVARAQAQSAADAAALAAATTFAFDTIEYGTAQGVAERGAIAVASHTPVWGSAPTVTTALCYDVSPDCPLVAGFPEPAARTFFGLTVSVSPRTFPTYFSGLLGVTTQTVWAHATASVVPANTTACAWPLAIPDLWTEHSNPPDEGFSTYQYPAGPPNLVATPDEYYPPTFDVDPSAYPTGYKISDEFLSPTPDVLTATGLTTGPSPASLANPWPTVDSSHFVPVQIPRNGGGGFLASLTSCNQLPVRIGDTLTPEVGPNVTFAEVVTGASTLIQRDSAATWDGMRFRISRSCAAATPSCAALSPRLVALPVFDPQIYDSTRGGAPQVRIVNFVGFFIESASATEIRGHLSAIPGIADTAHPNIAYQWALMRTAVLTR